MMRNQPQVVSRQREPVVGLIVASADRAGKAQSVFQFYQVE
jgi:hypothetical protein